MLDITEKLELCRTTSRQMHIQLTKKAIVNYVYLELGASQQMTAYFLNLKNHTSISNHLKNHQDYLRIYKDYNNLYKSLYNSNLKQKFKEFYEQYRKKGMQTVYIAGKISGLDHQVAFNHFEQFEKRFSELGYLVVNPMKIVPKDADWHEAMKICIKHLLDCDKIFLMNNWTGSKGAKIEKIVAESTGIERIYSSYFEEKVPKFEVNEENIENFENN